MFGLRHLFPSNAEGRITAFVCLWRQSTQPYEPNHIIDSRLRDSDAERGDVERSIVWDWHSGAHGLVCWCFTRTMKERYKMPEQTSALYDGLLPV